MVLQGDLVLKHHLGKKTALKGLETLFIEDKKDEFLPYFVELSKLNLKMKCTMKIDGIKTKEAAQKLVQKQVWLVEEEFHKYAGKSAPISLLGFHMIEDGEDHW